MKLKLVRNKSKGNSTLGSLYIDGIFQCYTLEDVERPVKIAGETAIPKGTYKIVINMSNRFKIIMPLLLDVPGFLGVRIHSGNTHKDTEGCILVGTSKVDQDIGGTVVNSRTAFKELMSKLNSATSNITLEIV